MSLGNMREHGVQSVLAICQEASCGHSVSVSTDGLPDSFPVPDVALRLRCSACGSQAVKRQPDWRKGQWLGRGRRRACIFLRGWIDAPLTILSNPDRSLI